MAVSASIHTDQPQSPPVSPPSRTSSARHLRNMSSITSPKPLRPARRSDATNTSRSVDEEPKTAVRVAVRVRPPLKPSDPGYDLIPLRFREGTCNVLSPTNLSIQSPQGKKLFLFDQVFDENTTQEGVWDYLSDSVSSFVKGYNVSVLAYGQSGAGKSYTMGTSSEVQHGSIDTGIIPRAAHALFELLEGTSARPSGLQTPKRYSTHGLPTLTTMPKLSNGLVGKTWELRASYVEIYNEQLRDLLIPDHVPAADRPPIAIREDTKGRIFLTGLTQVNIDSVEDLLNVLSVGSTIRQTDATAINARSSRSHAIFSLYLVQKKSNGRSSPTARVEKRRSMSIDAFTESNIVFDSKLHFVDLAGSERLKNTGATGDRAKEGIAINAGLQCLGKVISQLSSKTGSAHISYRDSRLTRILQDSLGGSAVTFMVACVTPVAFHLNETLNTIHYAQRARAIQSKPVLQQSHEDGDRQALIERLRSEVAFLRDQIRHSESERRGPVDRNERSKERELQDELLDVKESYSALSSRHTKLIAELSKARANESPEDAATLHDAIGESAVDRITRSNSFAEAAEQMVLEYEKTIQALEASLSSTRASLNNCQTTLMAKETRIGYMETIQQQLQARVAKATHREANAASYMQDLEAKMLDATSEEERNNAQVVELRKELVRLREGEASAEEYISILEERLAEAEQDQEIMQQEIDRLEHVVERQRSINRLDAAVDTLEVPREQSPSNDDTVTSPVSSDTDKHLSNGQSIPDEDGQSTLDTSFSVEGEEERVKETQARSRAPSVKRIQELHNTPAQNALMADKVDNLTQELFDLRTEHETHLNEFENLQQKYQTALETLARLEYNKDTVTPEPAQTIPAVATPELTPSVAKKSDRESVQVSRSASAETTPKPHDTPTMSSDGRWTPAPHIDVASEADESSEREVRMVSTPISPRGDRANREREMEMFELLQADQNVDIDELAESYKSLALRHETAMRHVDKLKRELHLAQSHRPASPGFVKPIHRRRSEDVLGLGSDRVMRCFTSLRQIVNDNLESNVDAQQSFELNLNLVMNELHSRSERVAAVESELAAVRREMETKQTIISGLTRERSSLMASSPVDFSVVGQMREQLQESENKIRSLREQHMGKERELSQQIEELKSTLQKQQEAAHRLPTPSEERVVIPGGFPDDSSEALPTSSPVRENEDVATLQREVADWQEKHQAAVAAMQTSEADLLATIAGLEESLRKSFNADPSPEHSPRLGAEVMEDEHPRHVKIVGALKAEVEEYKTVADKHLHNFEELEGTHAEVMRQLASNQQAHETTRQELLAHQTLVTNLENQLTMHKTNVTIHQDSLEALQAAHSEEVASMQATLAQARADSEAQHLGVQQTHQEALQSIQGDLTKLQAEVDGIRRQASEALGRDIEAKNLGEQFQRLIDEGKELHGRHLKASTELKEVHEKLRAADDRSGEFEKKIEEMKAQLETVEQGLHMATEREKKSSRLVEELEEQLNATYDTQKANNFRMSTMQSDAMQARVELERELEEQKLKNALLEQQIANAQRQSVASNGSGQNRESLAPEAASSPLGRSASQQSSTGTRKSVAPTSLPMPPPSIPLPPLPGTPVASSFANPLLYNTGDRTASPTERAMSPTQNPSPPGSRHTSKESPIISQLVEEQEARIRTIEKHLFAEKQLTATLEEALVDLETSANRTKTDMESWRRKCGSLEDELASLRREKHTSRASLQAVEEEREMRMRAEKARQALEQRMQELNAGNKKKKKNALNCF